MDPDNNHQQNRTFQNGLICLPLNAEQVEKRENGETRKQENGDGNMFRSPKDHTNIIIPSGVGALDQERNNNMQQRY